VLRLPAVPDLPPPLRGASVVHVRFTHLGSAAEGERLFAPMRALVPPILDTVAEMPYTSIDMVHRDPPDPMPYWDRAMMLADLPAEAVDEFVALTGPDSGCPLAIVEIRQLGGAMDREPAVPDAVPIRGFPFLMFAFGVGEPDQEERMRGYLAKLFSGLAPWSAGRLPVGFMAADQATTPEQLRVAYGMERYDHLARVKQAYDPGNMFRMEHNIVPADR
jgi:Berberine and berberine like